MESIWAHPGFFLILLSLLNRFPHKHLTRVVWLAAPVLAYVLLYWKAYACRLDIFFFYSEHVLLLGTCFLVALLAAVLFALSNDEDKNGDIRLGMWYAGFALSALLSNNLLVVFVCLEAMALGGTFIIFNGRTKASHECGAFYFKVHTFAGILFLIGTLAYYAEHNHFEIVKCRIGALSSLSLSSGPILGALLISIAAPPFSYWLTAGYAAATPAGSVFLSAYTTKVALFLIAKIFLGSTLLIYIGLIMAGYGIVYGAFEHNIRKAINFSIISQLGIILMAVGIGDRASSNGAALMLATGVLYNALLMICVGSATLSLETQKHYKATGYLAQRMPFVAFCCVIACSAISALPFTVGYLGKYYLYQSPYFNKTLWLQWSSLALSAGIMFSSGIKVPASIFFANNKPSRGAPYELSTTRLSALFILMFCCVVTGCFPRNLMHVGIKLDAQAVFKSFSMFASMLLMFLVFKRFWPSSNHVRLLDFSYFYRALPPKLLTLLAKFALFIATKIQDICGAKYLQAMHTLFGPKGFLSLSKHQKHFLNVATAAAIVLLYRTITQL